MSGSVGLSFIPTTRNVSGVFESSTVVNRCPTTADRAWKSKKTPMRVVWRGDAKSQMLKRGGTGAFADRAKGERRSMGIGKRDDMSGANHPVISSLGNEWCQLSGLDT